MAEDAEYIIFDPPRYFSSHQLKLTYKVCSDSSRYTFVEFFIDCLSSQTCGICLPITHL